MKILFAGGGSIGHISPSVAVSEQLDAQAHFVCSPRKDDVPFLEINKKSYTVLDAPRLSVSFLWKFPRAVCASKKILKQQKPDLVFSTGGYLSAPVCIAAKLKGIPVILYEPEVKPGLANRVVSFLASTRITNHDVGYPIRKAVTHGSRERGLRETGLSGSRPILLVMGGSQGAKVFNDIVIKKLDEILETFDVIHITGKDKRISVETRDLASLQKRYFQTEFSSELLPDFYACADVALSRSGTGSVAELAANGIPAVFVPLHIAQRRNAERSQGILLEESALDKKLIPTLKKVSQQKKTAHELDSKAARLIAEIIVQTLDQAKEDQ